MSERDRRARILNVDLGTADHKEFKSLCVHYGVSMQRVMKSIVHQIIDHSSNYRSHNDSDKPGADVLTLDWAALRKE